MAYDLLAKLKLQDDFSGKLQKIDEKSRKFQGTVDSINRSTERMQTATRAAHSAFGTLGDGGKRAISGIGSAIGKTIGAVTSFKAALIGAGASYAAVFNPLKLSSDAETASIAFTTVLGSAEKAQSFLAGLTDFANNTPFELPQLRDASKKMLAYGFAAESILPMLTSVGDASAGLGAGQAGIESITRALGQIKSNGRLNSEDVNQLTDVGVSAWSILAEAMGQSEAQVRKLTEKGLIPADKAIQSLVDGMEKRFPHAMAAQSKSLSGMYSTMKDTFNNDILKRWGDGLSNTLRPRFEQLNTWIKGNGPVLDRWGAQIQTVAAAASDAIVKKFEGAFNYVKRLTSDPEFTRIPDITGKVEYIIRNLSESFTKWMAAGGSKQIEDVANSVTSFLSASLGAVAQPLIDAGIKMGRSLGSGIVSGLDATIQGHPFLSSLAVAAATPGGVVPKLVTGTGTFLWSEYQNIKQGFTDPKKVERAQVEKDMKKFYTPDFVDVLQKNYPGWQPPGYVSDGAPKNAGGLSSVPYNGYKTILHKNEQVLTAGEADDYRSGNGGSGRAIIIQKFADTINVRNDADIYALAREMAYAINSEVAAVG